MTPQSQPEGQEQKARVAEAPYAASEGYSLAMRVLQSDLYPKLDAVERAECDEFIWRGRRPAAPLVGEVEAGCVVHGLAHPCEDCAAGLAATLDGSRFAEVRSDGSYQVCAEWDADSVIVPIAAWRALLTRPTAGQAGKVPVGYLRLEADDNESASHVFYPTPVEGSFPVYAGGTAP